SHDRTIKAARLSAALPAGTLERGTARHHGFHPAGSGNAQRSGTGRAFSSRARRAVSDPARTGLAFSGTAEMSAAGITIEHLEVRYGPVSVLRDLSLEVTAGELMAILGPSGCGKSTLLKAIAGLVEVQRGEIRSRDLSIIRIPPEKRNA